MNESAHDALEARWESIERVHATASAGPRSLPLGRREASSEKGDDERRWSEIDAQLVGQIAGRTALAIGPSAAYDASAFRRRGAGHVLTFNSPNLGAEGQPLTRADEASAVDETRMAWQELDPDLHGTFDIVHCDGLVHCTLEPLALLRALRRMTADGGTLLIGSMMIDDPERSEYLRFIPDRCAGDPTWWFLPGQLAFRWLVQTAGFEVLTAFGEHEGPQDALPLVSGYLLAAPR